MRRAVLFNIAATVHTVSTAKTLGVASLTWETDCSVLLPGCCLELQLCAWQHRQPIRGCAEREKICVH